MTVTATELLHSRTLALEGIFLKANRTFKVWEPDDPTAQLNLVDAYTAIGLPQIGDIHPELPSLKAIEHGGLHEVGINIYEITWRYEGIDPEAFGIVQHNVNQHIVLTDEYREEPTWLPIQGNLQVAELLETDIGGLPIDVLGTPTTVFRLRESIVLTEFFDTIVTIPTYLVYGLAIGTRNDTAFLGAQPGTIAYRGAVSRTVRHTIIAITHTFIWDQFFHLVQVPLRDQDGRVELEVKPGGQKFAVAKEVYWRQPIPLYFDHNAISSNF